MAEGWVSIHRKLLDNRIWEKDVFSRGQAWIDIILLANYEDKKVMFDGSLILVERGSKITSIRKLSERWKRSRGKVKRFLDLLQADGMIEYKTDHQKTTYKICNYNTYQNEDVSKRATDGPVTGHRRATDGPVTDTNNKENKVNNLNNVNKTSSMYHPIMEAWNGIGGNVSQIQTIRPNTTRYKLLNARINDYGQEAILQAIENIKYSPFLQGSNNKGRTISFDRFIKPDNFPKVLEGNYIDKNYQEFKKNFDIKKHVSPRENRSAISDREWEEMLRALDD